MASFGYELPPVELSSEEIEKKLAPLYDRLKLPPGRLELMSGIKTRRFWPSGTRPSQAAILAGEKALLASEVDRKEIGALVFTSVSRDMMEPATASFVHKQLGLSPQCHIFDISNACLGFLNGMLTIANMIELGQIEAGLVVAGETAEELYESTLSHLLADPGYTRKTIKPVFASLTIGSGSVAILLTNRGFVDSGHYLSGGAIRAHTDYNNLCQGGQNSEQGVLMSTDSEELLEKGVETARYCWQDFTKELGWRPEEISSFFCHQVGKAHASLLFSTLGLDEKKNFATLATLGNIGSVSAPITMVMGIEQEKLMPGEKGAVLGIGSGINSLMLGIEW